MSGSIPPTLAQMEALVFQSMTNATRKQQEMRYQPFLAAFAGMTAGAALFAAEVVFGWVFWSLVVKEAAA